MMSYQHITAIERGRIQELLSLGYTHSGIAEKLHRHRSCIDREVHRNSKEALYCAEVAQTQSELRRNYSVSKEKYTPEIIKLINRC